MTEYIKKLRSFFLTEKQHRELRQKPVDPDLLAEGYAKLNLGDVERSVLRLKWVLENEKPVVLSDEKIAIIRTVPVIPEIYTADERARLKKEYRIHELGKVSNINPDYYSLIDTGFNARRKEIIDSRAVYFASDNKQKVEYLDYLLVILDMIEAFAERYRIEALKTGNEAVAGCFSHIPQFPPRNFMEALQFFRLLHFCLWAGYNYHNTIGRFDQNMLKYLEQDLASGSLDRDSALELVEEFFISFNKDSDTYPGMQQGDNGQSIVLGGSDVAGNDQFNELSELCLEASLELKLIDPKINIRINKNTPAGVYEKGTRLTREGMGFPQYSNDAVVVPALIRWGYDAEDAFNYVVAACWEFIIPSRAMDINNIDALSFLGVVQDALPLLPECKRYEDFAEEVKKRLFAAVDDICRNTGNLYMEPSPMLSLLTEGCIDKAQDVSLGAKYNNYGIHGTGLSSAADSLAAIKKYVFDEGRIDGKSLLDMLAADFAGYESIWTMLRYEAPKMGNDDDYADDIATDLLDWFAESLEGRKNGRGGIFRPGTGSAMYYLWHSEKIGATPDGRKSGEAIACNFSPSLFARCSGPVSIIKSFSKQHLEKVANGGPLTIELHDTVFRTEESIRKVAAFVKAYMDLGGLQMQINAVNRETMVEAKKHPEKYRNLIVRVWGWSGYFVELDEMYQDHIMSRMELQI